MKNPYEVLGVSRDASEEEIKTQYRRLSKKYHPDNPTGDSEKFDELQKAYEAIKSGVFANIGSQRKHLKHKTLFTFA